MLKKLFLFNLLFFLSSLSTNAQTAVVKEPDKTNAAEIRRQSFEKVWTTVTEVKHGVTIEDGKFTKPKS